MPKQSLITEPIVFGQTSSWWNSWYQGNKSKGVRRSLVPKSKESFGKISVKGLLNRCNILYLLGIHYLGQGVSNASADFKRRPIDIHDQSSMISTIYQSRFPVILLTFGKGWSVYHSKSYERFLPLLKLPKYHRHWIHFHNQSRGTCKNIFTM